MTWYACSVFFFSCSLDLSFSSGLGVGGFVLTGDFSLAVSLLQMGTPESTLSLASSCTQQALQCPLKRVFFPFPILKRPHYLPPKSSPRLDLESSSRKPLPEAGVPGSEFSESSWKSSLRSPTPRVCDWAGVRWGWRICISNKFSDDMHVAGLRTTLRTADPTLSHNSISLYQRWIGVGPEQVDQWDARRGVVWAKGCEQLFPLHRSSLPATLCETKAPWWVAAATLTIWAVDLQGSWCCGLLRRKMKRIWDPNDVKPAHLWYDGDDDWNLGTSLKHSEINLLRTQDFHVLGRAVRTLRLWLSSRVRLPMHEP